MLQLVVDAANVVGSRPDGWWRDRAGAARRLAEQVVAVLVARPDELLDAVHPHHDHPHHDEADHGSAALRVHLVLEGAARGVDDLPTHPLLDVVRAPTDGDSAIVALVGRLAGGTDRVLVVTADRALRERVRTAGADVVGPGTLLGVLPTS